MVTDNFRVVASKEQLSSDLNGEAYGSQKKIQLPGKYKRVIQIELNEISQPVINGLISRGKLPNFAKINQEWSFYQTISEQKQENCEPWIQWVTAHTGKTLAEHQIFRLGDSHHLQYPQIFETLSEQGVQSAIVNCMNVSRGHTRGGVFFPDPWSFEGDCFPREVKPLWKLISTGVRRQENEELSLKGIAEAIKICLQLQIPISTYIKIFNQLIHQKFAPKIRWKIVGLLDLFLAEIFKHLLVSTDFGFYSLFLNSVAHYQHHYWRNFDSTIFNQAIKSPSCREFDNPMEWGYQLYDRILGEILDLTYKPETLIIVASGLSQIPFLEKESQGGMCYYRLQNHQQFIADYLGLNQVTVHPLMSRDWKLKSNNSDSLASTIEILSGLEVEGEALFNVFQEQSDCLFIETSVTKYIADDAEIVNRDGKSIAKFGDVFVNTAIKSGFHTGNGCLWISETVSEENGKFPQSMQLTELYDLSIQALIS